MERTKAFSSLAKYLQSDLMSKVTDLSMTQQGLQKYTMLKVNMDSIVQNASDKGTWSKAKRMEKEYTAEKKKHMRSAYPGLQEAVADCAKNWNRSKTSEKDAKQAQDIYGKAERSQGNVVSVGDYNKFTQILLLGIAVGNSNRKAVSEEVTNQMIWSAEDVYKDREGNIHVGNYGCRGMENIGKVITMQWSSGATKTEETVSLYLSPYHLNMCRMYKDIKRWFFAGDKATKVRSDTRIRHANAIFFCSWKAGARTSPTSRFSWLPTVRRQP